MSGPSSRRTSSGTLRQRAISSVGVVAVGLVAALLGGPVYAVVMLGIGLVAYHEYRVIVARLGLHASVIGFAGVVLAAGAGYLDNRDIMFAVLVLCAMVPLGIGVLRAGRQPVTTGREALASPAGIGGWAGTTCGTLYIAIPTMFAISLRERQAGGEAGWLDYLASTIAVTWDGRPTGLGWILTFTLIGWFSDSGAYLIGRQWGRRPLAPRISPKKTVEGAFGGLIGGAIAAAVAIEVFRLDCPLWLGVIVGLMLTALGMIGDLAESLIKRQAGVKDSGTIIPGHGGILDRFDAMYVILTAGWFAVEGINWYLAHT